MSTEKTSKQDFCTGSWGLQGRVPGQTPGDGDQQGGPW